MDRQSGPAPGAERPRNRRLLVGLMLVASLPAVAAFFFMASEIFLGNGGLGAFDLIVAGIVVMGLVVAFAAWRARQGATARRSALERRYPGQPWQWRADWASRRIRYSDKDGLGLWVLALIWNAAAFAAAFVVIRDGLAQGEWGAFFILVFPLIGLLLLGMAVHATLKYLRYGVSTFELFTLPGEIGHSLQGQVHTRLRLKPGERVTLRLMNYERTTTGFVLPLLLVLLTLQMWIGSTRLVIEPGRLRVRNRFAGLGRWKDYAPKEIVKGEPVIVPGPETRYFYLRLWLGDGRRVKLGWMNSPATQDAHAEAQWLTDDIRSKLKAAAR